VVEVLGGTRESHEVHRFIHHSMSIKLTRALPPIQHRLAAMVPEFSKSSLSTIVRLHGQSSKYCLDRPYYSPAARYATWARI
jgi:hypothetical protein